MVDILSMVDLTSISAMLAAIGVRVGVVFAVLQLRDLVRTRQTDTLMKLHSTWTSQAFLEAYLGILEGDFKDYEDYREKYGVLGAIQVGALFESVGILVHRKLVDIGLVYDMMPVKEAWENMKPIAEGLRKQRNYPEIWQWFESLYNEVQKREQTLQQTQP